MLNYLFCAFFLFLASFNAVAQNVNIPDIQFKSALLADLDINTNGDDEISVSEAEAFSGTFTHLGTFSNHIGDITGIEAFVNMTGIGGPPWVEDTIDLRMCQNLQSVSLSMGVLYGLDLRGLGQLKNVNSNQTQLNYIKLGDNPVLDTARIFLQDLDSLVFDEVPSLRRVVVWGNDLKHLSIDGPNVADLEAEDNALHEVDLTHCPKLQYLTLMENQLSELDLSGNDSLVEADVSSNLLASISFGDISSIESFFCNNNQLSTLDLTNQLGLKFLLTIENPLLSMICVSDTVQANAYTYESFDDYPSDGSPLYMKDSATVWAENCNITGSAEWMNELSFDVFPVPVKEIMIILASAELVSLLVLNSGGTVVFQSSEKNQLFEVSTVGFPQGVYYVKTISSDGRPGDRKIFIQN